MKAGRLRHRLLIEEPIHTQDAYGADVVTWQTFLTDEPCSIRALAGRELLAAAQIHAEVSGEIELRYRATLLPTMRGTDESGTVYEFLALLPDPTLARSLRLLVRQLPP